MTLYRCVGLAFINDDLSFAACSRVFKYGGSKWYQQDEFARWVPLNYDPSVEHELRQLNDTIKTCVCRVAP